MRYGFQNELSNKADSWQVNNLEEKIRSVSQERDQLERIVGGLRADLQTTQEAMRKLIDYLVENSPNYDYNELQNIKNYL